jgi:glycosyltransferase involved in cell wall biosynthesis
MEVARNLVNLYQLRFSRRIRRGMNRAAVMLAANRATQSDLERSAGIRVELDLETGIDFPISPARPARDSHRPFRILWVGRLRTWKGLPLLLHAIAQLPTSREVELRVVGEGNCRRGWQKLASDLGIANRIEWLPRLPYRQSLQFYRWADAFAFTSLRDTSGTGLLESLACGLPIMGLNHQGAADIMTDQCAVRITVASPRDSIAGFVDAIERLAGNSAWHKALSDGALDRAREYAWNGRYAKMSRLYERAIQNVGSRTGT